MIIAAKRNGIRTLIVPVKNLNEAKLVHGIDVKGFDTLVDVIRYLEGKSIESTEIAPQVPKVMETEEKQLDFSDVKGQNELIEAVILAAAGGHNMLMIGEPGCGKTMIAQRIPTILPQMTEEECLEVTKIYSISGILPNGHALMKTRPFRAPHHNASLNAFENIGV